MNEDLVDPFQWSFGSSHHTEPKTNMLHNIEQFRVRNIKKNHKILKNSVSVFFFLASFS